MKVIAYPLPLSTALCPAAAALRRRRDTPAARDPATFSAPLFLPRPIKEDRVRNLSLNPSDPTCRAPVFGTAAAVYDNLMNLGACP